eukprot:3344072-Pleurochrysis_carterae.AAC.2
MESCLLDLCPGDGVAVRGQARGRVVPRPLRPRRAHRRFVLAHHAWLTRLNMHPCRERHVVSVGLNFCRRQYALQADFSFKM